MNWGDGYMERTTVVEGMKDPKDSQSLKNYFNGNPEIWIYLHS
jgi:hypothetical protein